MAVRKINLLQNNDEFFFKESTDKYLQSLANLGQRIGIKGDSSKYGNFTFNQIYNYLFNDYSILSNNFIGFIRYNNAENSINEKNAYVGIIDKELLKKYEYDLSKIQDLSNNDLKKEKYVENLFHTYILKENTNFLLNLNISDFSTFLKNSIIKVKNNILYIVLLVELLNTNIDTNKVVVYYQYDLTNKNLLYYLRLQGLKSINSINDLIVLTELDDESKLFSIYKINRSQLNSIYKYNTKNLLLETEIFNSILYFLTYGNISENNYINYFNDIDISDLDQIKNNNTVFSYFFIKNNYNEIESLVAQIQLDISENQSTYSNNNYIIKDDNNFNQQINDIISVLEQLNGLESNNIDILSNYIQDINNQKNDLIPKIFEYYNDRFYFESIESFYFRILQKIYETNIYDLLKEINNNKKINIENQNYNDLNCTLFIPVDLTINYLYNNNNNFEIFFSNDIFINFENLIEDVNQLNNDINNIVFSSKYVKQSKIYAYNFSISYNDYSDNLSINNIEVHQKYVLPFIDIESNNWFINNKNSGISSYIDNYIDQNIIILYTQKISNIDGNVTYNGLYLTNLNKNIKDKINQDVFIEKTFYISSSDLTIHNIDTDISNISCHVVLPQIINNNYKFFESTIVFSIIDKNCLDDTSKILYNNFSLCTLWKINTSNNDWELINDTNNSFLDLSNLFNAKLALNREKSYNNFIFQYIGILLDKTYNLNDLQDKNRLMLIYPEHKIFTSKDTIEDNNNSLSLLFKMIKNNISINSNVLDEYDNNPNSNNYIGNISNENNKKFLNTTIDDGEIGWGYSILKEDEANKDYKDITTNENTTINYNEIININDDPNSTTSERTQYKNKLISESETIITSNNYDYIFNTDCPSFNLSEIILNNINVLNRLNIVTPVKTDTNTKLYGAFVGTELDANKKNVFSIRSSNRMHNLGSQTLINVEDKDKFDLQDKLFINFNEIELKGKEIYTNSLFNKRIYLDSNKLSYKDYNTFIISGYIDNNFISENKQFNIGTFDESYISKTIEINRFSYNLLPNNTITVINNGDSINIQSNSNNTILIGTCNIKDKPYYVIDLITFFKNTYNDVHLIEYRDKIITYSKDELIYTLYNPGDSSVPYLAVHENYISIDKFNESDLPILTFNKEITLSRYTYINNGTKTYKYIISC